MLKKVKEQNFLWLFSVKKSVEKTPKNRQKYFGNFSLKKNILPIFFLLVFLLFLTFFCWLYGKNLKKKFCFWLFFSFEIFLLVFLPFLNFFADSTEKCLKFYWTFNNFLRTLKKRTAAKKKKGPHFWGFGGIKKQILTANSPPPQGCMFFLIEKHWPAS